MNKIITFIVASVFLSAGYTQELASVKLSGKIENPNSDSISILKTNGILVRTFFLDSVNSFSSEFLVQSGFYIISDGREQTIILLEDKNNLRLIVDGQKFDETISMSGVGAGPNNYLFSKYLLHESFGMHNSYQYYAKLNEVDFLREADSLHQLQLNLARNFPDLSADFLKIETDVLRVELFEKYSGYEWMRRYVTNDTTFKVSDSFPDPFKDLNIDNAAIVYSSSYLALVRAFLAKKTDDFFLTDDSSKDYPLAYLKILTNSISNQTVKNEMIFLFSNIELGFSKELDSVIHIIRKNLTDAILLKKVEAIYVELNKLIIGAKSPSFALTDVNGKLVTLDDFKGKLVYIDIWATWCSPCINEIPALKALQKKLVDEDIVFVSICKDDTEDQWKKAIGKYNLTGVQLFETNKQSAFFKAYNVTGIPHFILIDKEGNIVDAKANRPSNPDLEDLLMKWLK